MILLLKRFVGVCIFVTLILIANSIHALADTKYISVSAQEVMDLYMKNVANLNLEKPVQVDNFPATLSNGTSINREKSAKFLLSKDTWVTFGNMNEQMKPSIVYLDGAPAHDFKFHPRQTEHATIFIAVLLTKSLPQKDFNSVQKRLGILNYSCEDGKERVATANNVSFEIRFSKVSGLYFTASAVGKELNNK